MRILPPLPELTFVCFDPGETTGVVEIVTGELAVTWSLTIPQLYEKLAQGCWLGYRIWVMENFLLYAWKAKSMEFNDMPAPRVIGALELIAYIEQHVVIKQTAQAGKAFASDERLKAYGWWQRCHSKHEKDAARHALYYMFDPKRKEVT
jgi:hypothetical protein